MAGGVGSRFWPYSRTARPKQFLDFLGTGRSLLQMTFDRFAGIVPTVACPHLPENTRPASELGGIKIDQVVIGSCTNGRMEDMEAAYRTLAGRKVADGVRCIIIPGTMQILRECVERGYYTSFIDAGAVVSTPTCGPCLGGYMGILAEGERCISTTNRNFVGRMGHVKSEVYLASPLTAAASALTGYITEPKEA